ncbi:MAG: thiol protease/hemagglutinin PrtT [Bacteroidetes bacterium]|nr:thiol protease/hemagglutinin PrtT [Bacteroidota bacterium]
MKKNIFLFIFLLLDIVSFAAIVPIETARKVAVNFYYERVNIDKAVSKAAVVITKEFAEIQNNTSVCYIFNIGNDNGFVIVSAESNTIPVLAYSFEKNYYKENISPAFNWLLTSYENEIIATRSKNLQATDEINNLWLKYSCNSFKSTTAINAVSPLLGAIIWDQGCFYNDSVPADVDPSYCNHNPTGCVATAMAMIMKYNAWPAQGQGAHAYNHSTSNGFTNNYGILSANFATTYNWASMPNDVTIANAQVAKIMRHCGTAVEMDYDINGSGAYVGPYSGYTGPTAQSAFVSYFKYPTAVYYQKVGFTDADWKTKIKNDIDASLPILYGGDGPDGGHAFVLDGYAGAGNDYFHFNFGWGGSNNGYFYVTSINSGNGDFTNNQEGVFSISKPTGIDEAKASIDFDIYPNPNNGLFTFNFPAFQNTKNKLEIYNLIGEKVLETAISKEITTFNLSSLSKGMYYLKFSASNSTITKKITILK